MRELSIISLSAGAEHEWNMLFEEYYALMCHLAYQYVKDDFTAETIVGDVMCNLWEKREHINPNVSLKNYLLQSVRNRCLDYQKSFHYKNMVPLSADAYLYDNALSATQPLGILLSDEFEGIVRRALDSLPEETKRVLDKSRIEGMKYEEIARECGISVNTVKYHIKKSLSAIRSAVEKYM